MAITKTHPIRSTLNLAIEYILNPPKTDDTLLCSSYGCSPETADCEEYKKLKKQSAEINIVKQNIDMLLGGNLNKERKKEQEIE